MNAFEQSPQYKSGDSVAGYLDRFFKSQGWTVTRTTPHEERKLCLGDRKLTKTGKKQTNLEYKSGIQTHYTGNVFLETISVDSAGKPGWVYTCKADYIVYACLLDGCILVFRPDDLRDSMDELTRRYPCRATSKNQNKGYNTHGLLIPLKDAKSLAYKIIET